MSANNQLIASASTITVNEQFWIFDANAGVPDTRSNAPTSGPTSSPAPTSKPTSAPTQKPTSAPTQKPTSAPTQKPTSAPTQKPTSAPSTPAPTQKPTSSPTGVPALGYLQSKSNGLYVTLNSAGNLVATATSTSAATIFNYATVTGGYSIQARSNNQFVTAENGGGSPLAANRQTVSGWETFLIAQTSGYFAITATANNKYVAVQTTNANLLIATVATGGTVPDIALYSIVAPASSPAPTASINVATATQVKLFSKSLGAFITVDGAYFLSATSSGTALATTFAVATTSSGTTLQNTLSSQYVSADNAGATPLVANRPTAAGWESFTFVPQSGSTYSILAAANNQLVSVQSNGQLIPNVANSGTVPTSALFYVVAP